MADWLVPEATMNVDDFPITNSSKIRIIHLPNNKYVIARADFYNKQPITYQQIIQTEFDSVTATEHFVHNIYINLIGMPTDIMRPGYSNLLDHDSFLKGGKTYVP